MIKVGDYAKYKNDILIVKKTYMYSFVGISLTHGTKHILDYDNDVSWLVDYEDYEQQKQRADYLEKYIKIMKDNYSEINKDTQTILRTTPDDVLLKARIRWNNDVIKILDKILEDDNA